MSGNNTNTTNTQTQNLQENSSEGVAIYNQSSQILTDAQQCGLASLAISCAVNINIYSREGNVIHKIYSVKHIRNTKFTLRLLYQDGHLVEYVKPHQPDLSGEIKEGSFNPYGNGQTSNPVLALMKKITREHKIIVDDEIPDNVFRTSEVELFNQFALLMCRDLYRDTVLECHSIPGEDEIDWSGCSEYDDVIENNSSKPCDICVKLESKCTIPQGVGKDDINQAAKSAKYNNIDKKKLGDAVSTTLRTSQKKEGIKKCYFCGSTKHVYADCQSRKLKVGEDDNNSSTPCKCNVRLSRDEVMEQIAERITKGMKTDIQVIVEIMNRQANTQLLTSAKFINKCLEGKEVTRVGQFLTYLYAKRGLGGIQQLAKLQLRYNLGEKWVTVSNSDIDEQTLEFIKIGDITYLQGMCYAEWVRDLTNEGVEPNPGPDGFNNSENVDELQGSSGSNSNKDLARNIKNKRRLRKIHAMQHKPHEYRYEARDYYKNKILEQASNLAGHKVSEDEVNRQLQEQSEPGYISKILSNIAHYVFGKSNFIGPGYTGGEFGKVTTIDKLADLLAIEALSDIDEAAREHDIIYSLTTDKNIRHEADKQFVREADSDLLKVGLEVRNNPVFGSLFDYLIGTTPRVELRHVDITRGGDVEKNPGPVNLEKLLLAIRTYLHTYGHRKSILTNTSISIGLTKNRLNSIYQAYYKKFIYKSKYTSFERYGPRDGIMDSYTSIPVDWPNTANPAVDFALGVGNVYAQCTWAQLEHGAGNKLLPSGLSTTFVGGQDEYARILAAFRTNSPISNGDLAYIIWFLTKTDDSIISGLINEAGGNNADILYNIWMLAYTLNANCLWCPVYLRAEGMNAVALGDVPVVAANIWPRYPDTTWNAWIMSAQDFISYNLGTVRLNPLLDGTHITFCMMTSDMLNPQNDLAKFIWLACAGPFGLCQVNSLWDLGIWETAGGPRNPGVAPTVAIDFSQSVAMNITAPKNIILVRSDLGNNVQGAPVAWSVTWQNNIISSVANNAAGVGGVAFNLRQLNGLGTDSTLAYLQQLVVNSTEAPFTTAERWWVQLYGNKADYRTATLMMAINSFGYLPVPSFALTDINVIGINPPDMLRPRLGAFFGMNKPSLNSDFNLQAVWGAAGGNNVRFKDCMGMEKQLVFIAGVQGDLSLINYTIAPMAPIRKYALAHGERMYDMTCKLLLSEITPINTNSTFFEWMELSVSLRKCRDEQQRSTGMSEWTLLGNMLNIQAGNVDVGTLIPELNEGFFDSTTEMSGIENWIKQIAGINYHHPQQQGRGKGASYVYDYTFCGTEFYINDATSHNREALSGEKTLNTRLAWNNLNNQVMGVFDNIGDINFAKRFFFDYRFYNFWLVPDANHPAALGTIAYNESEVLVAVFAQQNTTNSITMNWTRVAETVGVANLPAQIEFTEREYIPDFTGVIVSGESQNRQVSIAVTGGSERPFTDILYNAYVMLDLAGHYSTTTLNFTNVIRLPPLAEAVFNKGRKRIEEAEKNGMRT